MAAIRTGSNHISACRPLRNDSKIMFYGSGNTLMLLPTVSDISGSRYSRRRQPEPATYTTQAESHPYNFVEYRGERVLMRMNPSTPLRTNFTFGAQQRGADLIWVITFMQMVMHLMSKLRRTCGMVFVKAAITTDFRILTIYRTT